MNNYGKKGKIMKSTIVKVGVGFLLGATAIGGVATAANSEPIATTGSPTLMLEELPIFIVGRLPFSTLRTAKS